MALETVSGIYERAVVIANHQSTNAGRFDDEIASLPLEIEPIPVCRTPDKPLQHDVEQLWGQMHTTLRPDDLVIVRSGDGLLHYVVNGLLQDDAVAVGINRAPLLALPEGKANDVSSQLLHDGTVRSLLETAKSYDLCPLEATIEHTHASPLVRRALGYFSIGGTAVGAHRVDNDRPEGRLARMKIIRDIRDKWTVLKSVAQAPERIYSCGDDEIHLTDRVFIRGSQIAGEGRAHASLARDEIEDIQAYAGSYFRAARLMLALRFGVLDSTMIPGTAFRITSGDGNAIDAQYDGEHTRLLSGSTVTVGISDLTYRALANHL